MSNSDLHDHVRAAKSGCVLAVPFTRTAVRLLLRLAKAGRASLVVLETPPVKAALGSAFPARFVNAGQMIQAARAGGTAVYVTFPDHEVTGDGTMWSINFLGEPHFFSTLEPLLMLRSGLPLFTLEGRPAGLDAAPTLHHESLCRYSDTVQVFPDHARAVLEWLARRLEDVLQAAPDDVISWDAVRARSSSARVHAARMHLRACEAILHQWHAAREGLDTERYASALGELSSLQEQLIGRARR